MKNKNLPENLFFTFFVFLSLFTILETAKVILLPLYDLSPNEPLQITPKSIYDSYSKSDACTFIKFGKPILDLQVIFEEQKFGFYISDQGCYKSIPSEYSPTKSSTFYSDQNITIQYINNEKTKVLSAEETITLFQPLEEYFYSSTSLEERTNGKYQKPIKISNFDFLYLPNSEEIKEIKEKKNNNENKNNTQNGKSYIPYDDYYGNLVFGNDSKNNDGFLDPFSDTDGTIFDNDKVQIENNNLCGHLGLLSPAVNNNYESSLSKSFIKQLKEKNIIDSYNWYVRFNKDYSGEFFIGAAPHEIKPNNYLEENLNIANAKFINDYYYWEISFSSVYYTNNKNKEVKSNTEKTGLISFNYNFIIADNEYYENIYKDYFEEYIKKTICQADQIKDSKNKYILIYCDEKKFSEAYMEKFPEINLKSPGFNFIFKIDYKDVFMKARSQIIFKILFSLKKENSNWTLGKLFLTKYQFVFNHDSKTFGFYTTFIPETIKGDHGKGENPIKNEKEQNKLKPSNRIRNRERKIKEYKSKTTNWYKIIIIALLIFVLVLLGCYAIKKWNFRNKVDSNTIENYKKFKPKNKMSRLSDEDANMEQI